MSDNNSSSNNIHTKTVFIFDADDGMTLSKDVLNSDGSLIAASGTKLDMDMIAKISANHILEIEIIDKDYTEPVRPVENDNSTYYEKVRNSKEFKAFCKEYNEGISDLKSQLNDIVNRNADVDVDELLTYPLSLMNTYSNKLQMFDMLHSLRQFDDLTYAHSVNVALVASIIGEWLGYSEEDVHVLTLCGLLHDIGKAVDHEMEGTHVEIGMDLLKRYKESKEVIHAMSTHHGDYEPQTIEAVLVTAADAISAARPGARRETLEAYIRRLEKLEEIANSYEGVDKSFAIQAGREIRIMVKPENVSDEDIHLLARDMTKRIEDELEYPGQIKVSIIRETRAIEYAK